MLHSLCLLHLYHPLASLSAECRRKTQDPRIISSVLGTEREFGLVSASTCWAHFAAVIEITCQYCCVPFTNGLFWRKRGRVVPYSETGALYQSNRNDLWTEVHAHPKEQVIVRGFFWFLPKPVVKGGAEEQAMPNCWLPHMHAMLDCKQGGGPCRLFVHDCKMLAHASALAQSGKWLAPAKALEQVISPVDHGIGLRLWDFSFRTCSAAGEYTY